MKNGAVKRVGIWTNRRYINRLLLLFWIFVFAVLIRACNPPAYAVAGQAETEPPAPAVWTADPMAGVVLEPVSEEMTQ